MSYRPQRNARHGTGRATSKTHREKSKTKEHQHRSAERYLKEDDDSPKPQKIVEKILSRLQSLGNQTFAFSPFSQYFSDWIISLESVISEFESNPAVKLDNWFMSERSRIISIIEQELENRRREENVLGEAVRKLAEKNQLQTQRDMEYATATGNIASKRNSENQRLTRVVRELEQEFDQTKQIKASILSLASRKAKAKKMEEVVSRLDSARKELELVDKNFHENRRKLEDEYEREKQVMIEEKQGLEKQIERLDVDSSKVDRRIACENLAVAVKALIQRNTS